MLLDFLNTLHFSTSMSVSNPSEPRKDTPQVPPGVECEICYGLATKFSGSGDATCYGYTIRKRVPKEAIEDLEAVTPLPPNTKAFTIGKCVYSAETSKSGRPPLLIGGILIANTSDAPKTDNNSSSSQKKDPKGGQSKALTPAEVYDKLATGLPVQYENIQKAVKTTANDFKEFYPVFKVALGKTADELPGQLKMGAGLTWQACGKTLDQLVAKITEADPKDKKK